MRALEGGLCFLLLGVGGATCGNNSDPDPETVVGPQSSDAVTYTADIKPLLDARCTACHAADKQGADRRGAPGDVDLDSYAAARDEAEESNERIQDGTMPPAGPLSAAQKALFQAWVDKGSPE